MKVRVKVPASSANLGPGFDTFGLAVELYNEFFVETDDKFNIEINGDNEIPETADNLFYQSFCFLFEKAKKKIPKVKITINIKVPQGRGLGSSATAVVGGLVAANTFLQNKYSNDELLPEAIELERGKHPDNVTPSLFGGFVVVTKHNSEIFYVQLPFPKDLKTVYFIPDFVMDTAKSRMLMPEIYLKHEVVSHTGRIALLLAALQTGQHHLLKMAMDDCIHQPTRARIFPLIPKIISAAIQAGAYGAALSGGGSAIISFADNGFDKIAKSMKKAAQKEGMTGVTIILPINTTGCEVNFDKN